MKVVSHVFMAEWEKNNEMGKQKQTTTNVPWMWLWNELFIYPVESIFMHLFSAEEGQSIVCPILANNLTSSAFYRFMVNTYLYDESD